MNRQSGHPDQDDRRRREVVQLALECADIQVSSRKGAGDRERDQSGVGTGNCYLINNVTAKPKRTVPKPVFWQHSAKVARLRKREDDIHTARVSIMAEFRQYPLRVEQSKLDGWWFVFVDALPEVVVFGPNYEDLLGRLKRAARNVFRAQGEIVTDIEITTIESGEAAIALWVVPGVKTGSIGAPLNASL